LRQDLAWEQQEADKLLEHCKQLQVQVTEKEEARRVEHAKADRYFQQRAEQDEDYEALAAEHEKLENKLSERDHTLLTLQNEYNDALARLQSAVPSYKPFQVQIRDRTNQLDRNRNTSPQR
jgi:pyridoxine/pyridoxamine 5'-phosphate oxidase